MKKALLASVAFLGLSMGTAMATEIVANEGNGPHNHEEWGHLYHGHHAHHAHHHGLTLVAPGVLAAPSWNWQAYNGVHYYDMDHGFYAYPADPELAKQYMYFEKGGEYWVVTKTAPTLFYAHAHHGHHHGPYDHIIYVAKHPADDMLHELLSDPMRAQPPAPETH